MTIRKEFIVENNKKSKLGWLWENMKGYRALYVIGIIGTIVYNILQLTVPYVTSKIVDTFISGENAAANLAARKDLFYMMIFAMVGITILRTTTVYLVCMDMEVVSQRVL